MKTYRIPLLEPALYIVIALIAAVALGLPSPNQGSVTCTVVRGYDANFPSDTYFSGSTIYMGVTSGVASGSFPLSGVNYTMNIGGLTRGSTYYFWATQTGTNGVESDPGVIVAYTVPHKPSPANIKVSPNS